MGWRSPWLLLRRRVRYTHTVARHRGSDLWSPFIASSKEQTPGNITSHLAQAGYVYQSNAGTFHYLPLGLRVKEKIERLIHKQMRSIGASQVALSSLSKQDLWTQSGRLANGDELFKFTDESDGKWLLAPTHEEEITMLAKNAPGGFRQPLRLYQIGPKYRDEKRPRGGLLRGKEFIMKDLYTFDFSEKQALVTYDQVRAAYGRFFDELGVTYVEVRADSGKMGGNFSHEYHFPSVEGEDTIITCSHCDHAKNVEYVPQLACRVSELSRSSTGKSVQGILDGFVMRDFISEDHLSLIRVLLPASGLGDDTDQEMKDAVNTHVLKAALKGQVDIDTGVKENAVRRIFDGHPETGDGSTTHRSERKVYYVLDKRIDLSDVASLLNHDDFPEDVNLCIVESSSDHQNASSDLDLILPKHGDVCPSCRDGFLIVQNAIEIGHTFHLGPYYTSKLGLTSRGLNHRKHTGQAVPVEMGCHGIGVSRLIAAAARLFPSSQGDQTLHMLDWPKAIAPYHVCIGPPVGGRESELVDETNILELYDSLSHKEEGQGSIDVFLDDRKSP